MHSSGEETPEQLRAEIQRLWARIIQLESGVSPAYWRATDRLRVLADASHAFAEAGADQPAILDRVARMSADALGAGCVVWLRSDDSPWLPAVMIYDPDPEVQAVAQAIFGGRSANIASNQPAAAVIRSGNPLLRAVVGEKEARQIVEPALWPAFAPIRPHSMIVVPLRAHGQIVGSLAFSRRRPGQPAFTPNDLTLAQDLADRAALAIHNARLYQAVQIARQAAAEAHARLDALISSLPNGVGYLDHDLRFQMVNPALATINGIAPADHLGRTLAELSPDLAARVDPSLRQVLAAGEAIHDLELHNQAAPGDGVVHDWLVNYFPVRGAVGEVAGVGVTVSDITERRRRELDLAFLTAVADTLSHLSSVDEIMQRVGAMIGAHLSVASCLFTEIREAQDTAEVVYAWHAQDVADARGVYRLSAFMGAELRAAARDRQPVAVGDTRADPRVDAHHYAALGISAFVGAPSHRSGEWVYLLMVNASDARAWRDDEVDLIREVMDRTFPRIERARAEEQVRAALAAEHIARLQAESASDRTLRLQKITADLVGALTQDAVVAVVTGHGKSATGAAQIAVSLLSPDGQQLEVIGWSDLTPAELAAMRALPLSEPTPMSAAVRQQAAIWLSSPELIEGSFPGFGAAMAHFGHRALATLPLISADRMLGVMSFGFLEAKEFSPEDQAFIGAITQQSAQALDRARLHNETTVSRRRLQQLSQRLLDAQEQERRRIARELHDEVGQSLGALKINLHMLGARPEAADTAERISESMTVVDALIQQVRALSLELRPSVLDDLGLSAALAWYCDRIQQRTGLDVVFEDRLGDVPVPPPVATTCFRVVQEALTNVVRHASARRVSVSLRYQDVMLTLSICDDGVGFDVPAARAQGTAGDSLGLISMAERTDLAGGWLDISSAPGAGTEVWAWLPLGGGRQEAGGGRQEAGGGRQEA